MYKRAPIHCLYAYMYRQTDRHKHAHAQTHTHTHTHTHPNLNPNPQTYTHTFREQGSPYLFFGVDSRARLQQRKHRVLVPVLRGNEKRRGPVLPHRRGQGRVMPRWAGRTCIHACTWMRAWMCVREPIHAFACAHPSTCTHCVHMCVCIHTHTRVCIHTHKRVLKTQTLNSATAELKRGKQQKP